MFAHRAIGHGSIEEARAYRGVTRTSDALEIHRHGAREPEQRVLARDVGRRVTVALERRRARHVADEPGARRAACAAGMPWSVIHAPVAFTAIVRSTTARRPAAEAARLGDARCVHQHQRRGRTLSAAASRDRLVHDRSAVRHVGPPRACERHRRRRRTRLRVARGSRSTTGGSPPAIQRRAATALAPAPPAPPVISAAVSLGRDGFGSGSRCLVSADPHRAGAGGKRGG